MTQLTKPVTRRTDNTVRDRGKRRNLVITLYPGGVIGLRPAKTRREETITVEAVYDLAVKQRVFAERREKRSRRRIAK